MTYKSKSLVQAVDYNTLIGSGTISSSSSNTPITVTTYFNIFYGTDNLQTVDLLVPSTWDINAAKGTPPLGVILWIHGGGWSGGDKTLETGSTGSQIQNLVQANYIVINANYRLTATSSTDSTPTGFFPANVNDIETIVKFLLVDGAGYVNAPNISNGRQTWSVMRSAAKAYGLLVAGASAGGHLALMGVMQNAVDNGGVFPKAVVSLWGPMNLVSAGANDPANPIGSFAANLISTNTQNNPTVAPTASPYYQLTTWENQISTLQNTSCLFYFAYNDNDTLVPGSTSIKPFAINLQTYLNQPANVSIIEFTAGTKSSGSDGYPTIYAASHNIPDTGIYSIPSLLTTIAAQVFPTKYTPAVLPNSLNAVWGTGSGSSGYGQPQLTPLRNPATTNSIVDISVTDWEKLIAVIQLCSIFQGTVIPSLTSPTAFPYTKIAVDSNIVVALNAICNSRNNAAYQDTPVTPLVETSTDTWNNIITFENDITFTNPDKARYFFNMGGQISLNFGAVSGSNPIDSVFNTLASNCGTLYISGISTGTETIGGAGGSVFQGVTVVGGVAPTYANGNTLLKTAGYYGLTTAYTEIFRKTVGGNGSGAGSYISVLAKTNGSQGTNGDNGTVISIQTVFVQLPGGINNVSAGTNVICTVIPPKLIPTTVTTNPGTSPLDVAAGINNTGTTYQFVTTWEVPGVDNGTSITGKYAINNKIIVPATLGTLSITPNPVIVNNAVTISVVATNAITNKWTMTIVGNAGTGTNLSYTDAVTTSPYTISKIFTPTIADTLTVTITLDSGAEVSSTLTVNNVTYDNNIQIPTNINTGDALVITFSGKPGDTVTATGLYPPDPKVVTDVNISSDNKSYIISYGDGSTSSQACLLSNPGQTFTSSFGSTAKNYTFTVQNDHSIAKTSSAIANAVAAPSNNTVVSPQIFPLDSTTGTYTYSHANYSQFAETLTLSFVFGDDDKTTIPKTVQILQNGAPPVPTYSLTALTNGVQAGDNITFKLVTQNVPTGTQVPFIISGSGTDPNTKAVVPLTSSDFSNINLNGKDETPVTISGIQNFVVGTYSTPAADDTSSPFVPFSGSYLVFTTAQSITISKSINIQLSGKQISAHSVTLGLGIAVDIKFTVPADNTSVDWAVSSNGQPSVPLAAGQLPDGWLPYATNFASVTKVSALPAVVTCSGFIGADTMTLEIYYIDPVTAAISNNNIPATIDPTVGSATLNLNKADLPTGPNAPTNLGGIYFCNLVIDSVASPGSQGPVTGQNYPWLYYGKLAINPQTNPAIFANGAPVQLWAPTSAYAGGAYKDSQGGAHAYHPSPLYLIPGNNNSSPIVLPSGTTGSAYTATIYAVNGDFVLGYAWSSSKDSTIPPGLKIIVNPITNDENGYKQKQVTISGIPTQGGDFLGTLICTNGSASVSQQYKIHIVGTPSVVTSIDSSAGIPINTAYNEVFSNGPPNGTATLTGYFLNTDNTQNPYPTNPPYIQQLDSTGSATWPINAGTTLGSHNATWIFKDASGAQVASFVQPPWNIIAGSTTPSTPSTTGPGHPGILVTAAYIQPNTPGPVFNFYGAPGDQIHSLIFILQQDGSYRNVHDDYFTVGSNGVYTYMAQGDSFGDTGTYYVLGAWPGEHIVITTDNTGVLFSQYYGFKGSNNADYTLTITNQPFVVGTPTSGTTTTNTSTGGSVTTTIPNTVVFQDYNNVATYGPGKTLNITTGWPYTFIITGQPSSPPAPVTVVTTFNGSSPASLSGSIGPVDANGNSTWQLQSGFPSSGNWSVTFTFPSAVNSPSTFTFNFVSNGNSPKSNAASNH